MRSSRKMKEVFIDFVNDNLPNNEYRSKINTITLVFPNMIYPGFYYMETFEVPLRYEKKNELKSTTSYK